MSEVVLSGYGTEEIEVFHFSCITSRCFSTIVSRHSSYLVVSVKSGIVLVIL